MRKEKKQPEEEPESEAVKTVKVPDISKRRGWFVINGADMQKAPGFFLALFAHVVPIRCEYMFGSRKLHYTAFSPLFDEIDDHLLPPQYLIGIDNAGEITCVRAQDDTPDLII